MSFAPLVILGMAVGALLVFVQAPRWGVSRHDVPRFLLFVLAAGFAGAHLARLSYEFSLDSLEGISSFGGLAGGLLGARIWFTVYEVRREEQQHWLNLLAWCFPFAWIICRTACFIARDHPGIPSTHWLAVAYPDGPRLDLALIEILFTAAVGALFLVRYAAGRRDAYAALWFLLYGPFRMLLDRLHQAPPQWHGLTPDFLFGLVTTAAAAACILPRRQQMIGGARMLRILSITLLLAPALLAQRPDIALRGVVNSASYVPAGLPGGAIARGSVFAIFGQNLGPAALAQVSSFPLGDTFAGVSIKVVKGSTTVNAIPLVVSAGQINALMPSNAPLGWVYLRVTYNGVEGSGAPVFIADSAVGIYTATGFGMGPGSIQNFNSQADQPLNTSSVTAKPGQIVILWLTGLGPIAAADNVAPPVGDLPVAIDIFVGGKKVTTKYYTGRTPCCSGIDQLVFEIPADAPSGCFVPVVVKAGSSYSNTVTMAINAEGKPCSDPDNPLIPAFLSGGTVGLFELGRVSFHQDFNVFRSTRTALETASAYFQKQLGGPLAFDPNFALPPAGACTSYTVSGFLLGGVQLPIASPFPGLDTGNATITGPGGNRNLPAGKVGNDPGTYYNPVAVGGPATIPAAAEQPIYYAPGAYSVSTPGGQDLPAVQASPMLEGQIEWTNRDSFTTVDRSQPLTFQWTPSSKARVVVGAFAYDLLLNASTVVLCPVPAAASSFQIPAAMLAALPPARPRREHSSNMLFFASLPAGLPSPFSLAGLDFAGVLQRSLVLKTVRFR